MARTVPRCFLNSRGQTPVSPQADMISRRFLLRASACAAVAATVGACDSQGPRDQVTLYTAVDEPAARPVIQAFERACGIAVNLVTDTEARKTAGLAARLEAERSNPQADVWWSNEIFHTIRLTAAGVLAPYASPSAGAIPALFRDQQSRWHATALRARVIAVHTKDDAATRVRSLHDLLKPELRGRVCLAHPSAGTTSGHVAALYTLWGRQKADDFFRALKANGARLVGGNSVVAELVASGQMLAGLTDNDDVANMRRRGGEVDAVLPDQHDRGDGTLMIPCTAALVAGARNQAAARQLIDHLLSPQAERQLIDAGFAAYSVFGTSPARARPMQVDYAQVAANLRSSVESALTILEGR